MLEGALQCFRQGLAVVDADAESHRIAVYLDANCPRISPGYRDVRAAKSKFISSEPKFPSSGIPADLDLVRLIATDCRVRAIEVAYRQPGHPTAARHELMVNG